MSTDPSQGAEPLMPASELKADTVRKGDTVVCVLAGDLHEGTQDAARAVLFRALDSRPALLAIDLDAVELFTAAGLNVLLAVRDAARLDAVPFALVAPSPTVRRVLGVTGAAVCFSVHATVEEAAAARDAA
ncbi:STAS domain-containing protein [Streptomyces tritici]|uniref:STAS domain-containing protein n=1 Tax=Streptomyces tritici TaxID=2054410 RepID=UPI003AF0C675